MMKGGIHAGIKTGKPSHSRVVSETFGAPAHGEIIECCSPDRAV
jgi:hypothetical protein